MRTRIPLVAFRTTRIPLRYAAAQPDARERARAADLIVLPDGVAGTNCGNCLHFRDDYCTQPDVLMPVTRLECCIYWDAPGTVRVADLPPEPVQYAAAHAPKGGVTVGGKKFIGGQFIPAEVMADASPEERAAVESGETRPKPLPPPGGARLKDPRQRQNNSTQPPPSVPPRGPQIPPTPVRFDSPAAFAGSLAAAYAAGGHDPAIAQKVAAAILPNVLKRLSGDRLKSVTIHPTVEAVTDSFYTGDPQLRSIPRTRRQRSLGFYDTAACTLETDGGPDPAGTLAHEIGHAIDNEVDAQGGGAGSLSESAEFVAAWTKEIKATGNLTAYAATEPAEGFAEFARYLYSGNPAARAEAETEFPGVFAFFKKYGLV